MPSYKMRVHLDYPTFDNLPDDKKALVNFIMENGAAYFRGEYGDSTLLHMSGTVRPKSRILYNNGYNPEGIGGFDVNIMYTEPVDPSSQEPNPFDPSLLPDEGASIDSFIWKGDEYTTQSLHYEDGILDCNTVLREAHSYLNLYSVGVPMDSPYFPEAELALDDNDNPIFHVPVTLSPKIGDVVNTNSSIKPKFILECRTNVDGLHVCEIPIDREDMDFVYDQQLRTQDFWIEYYDEDLQENVKKKVFYKVGLVSFDSNYPISTLADTLLEHEHLQVYRSVVPITPVDYESGDPDIYGVRFLLQDVDAVDEDEASNYIVFLKNNVSGPKYIWVEQRLGSYNVGGIATSFVCTLYYTRTYGDYLVAGIMYVKLYEDTGSGVVPFDVVLDNSNFSLYDSASSNSPVSILHLPFTDQDMDGTNL